MSSDSDLDDLRRKRVQELRRQLVDEQTQARQQVQVQQEKQAILRQILTSEARDRLGRIRLVKPEFVDQLELQLIQAAQGGRLKLPITDAQLKELLSNLQTPRRGINIRGV